MSDDSQSVNLPPFPAEYRASGLLLHVTSLPSPYGIGDAVCLRRPLRQPVLPHNYVPNTVVYTGTHDNPTSREWYEELSPYQRQNLWRYLKSPEGKSSRVSWELMRLAWSSVAALAVAPLQDLLNLGPEARMNIPGRAEGNWTWRCSEEMMSAPAFDSLRDLTRTSNRQQSVPISQGEGQ